MLAGPKSGLTVVTSTPGEAAALAAAPIFSVIERVVLGLMTWMCMARPSRGRRARVEFVIARSEATWRSRGRRAPYVPLDRFACARDDGHLAVQSTSLTKSGLQDRRVRTVRELAREPRPRACLIATPQHRPQACA